MLTVSFECIENLHLQSYKFIFVTGRSLASALVCSDLLLSTLFICKPPIQKPDVAYATLLTDFSMCADFVNQSGDVESLHCVEL